MNYALNIAVTVLVLAGGSAVSQAQIPIQVVTPTAEQVILDADSFADAGEMAYLAFPAMIAGDRDEVLISYKRGRAHANDAGALLEVVRFNTAENRIESREAIGGEPKLIFQMGEWARFPSGTLANFVDVQQVVKDRGRSQNHRTGVQFAVSRDNGKSFSKMTLLPAIDGREYGYVFDCLPSGERLYVLAMTFPEQTEKKSKFSDDGKRIFGTVVALVYNEQEDKWSHLRDLNQEFGNININESCLIADGEGFIVATRGYDGKARLHRVDREFRELQSFDLTSNTKEIESHVGRPRLFEKDGQIYLLGRSFRNRKMELALFRLNKKTLAAEKGAILDPLSGPPITDGYYAMHYFRNDGNEERFNVVTYRRTNEQKNPDIVRLEFNWSDVR